MDGLIGSYGGVSDEEEMEFEQVPKIEEQEGEETENIENVEEKLSGEIEGSPLSDASMNTSGNSNSNALGLGSYNSMSPSRATEGSKTALNSLLSTYEDLDKTTNEDRNEEEIEKQYDVTVENSDSDSDSENFMGKLDQNGNVKIPSEAKGKCSSKLQEKIATELSKRRRLGYDFCSRMRDNKEFRNPSIYDKLIDLTGISETGTNFTDPILNKSSWRSESFYKQLAEKQQKDYDRRESERRKEAANDPNSKIKQTIIAEKKKESKWDEKSLSGSAKDKQLKAQLIQDKLNKQLMARNS